jgi:quinol monooxygenase YgiN
MVTLVAVLEAQEGKEKEMENALMEMIPKVQSEEGTLAYILHRSQNKPGKFLVYEKYKDEAALTHHSSTSYIKELFEKVGPLLAGSPSIETFEELAAKR